MLKVEELKDAATKSYNGQMQKKCLWLTDEVWPKNIDYAVQAINNAIIAGKALGVTEATPFSPEEIAEIAEDLSPLRQLEMTTQCRAYMKPLLKKHGIDETILD
ncbi:MAG: hypothetical protein KW802_02415 [Candidatus Doudnabacteria bacterium]|nr:hypothetical protein [Candidatus Doudnabacteria bacterium]